MTTPFVQILARVFVTVMLLALPLEARVVHAQGLNSLKERMFGGNKSRDPGENQAVPKVARFTSEDGQSFVFDSSQGALLRFDGDDEVWYLTATQGPKGDMIYKNDVGEPVIKTTRWGGITLFTDDRPTGDPAAVSGKAAAFVPDRVAPGDLWLHMAKSARRASMAVERLISFEAPDVTPESSSLYAEAVSVASDAIVAAAGLQSAKRHDPLDAIHEVQLVDGRPPSATVVNDTLVLKLDASRGTWGGHPSSKRILNVLITSYAVADDRH